MGSNVPNHRAHGEVCCEDDNFFLYAVLLFCVALCYVLYAMCCIIGYMLFVLCCVVVLWAMR